MTPHLNRHYGKMTPHSYTCGKIRLHLTEHLRENGTSRNQPFEKNTNVQGVVFMTWYINHYRLIKYPQASSLEISEERKCSDVPAFLTTMNRNVANFNSTISGSLIFAFRLNPPISFFEKMT